MTSYKELGLVNTREIFAKAVKGGYAIPAYNFNNMEQMQAIIMACVETKSPVILQVSKGARDYANINLLRNMAKGATEYAHELGYDIPIVLHLDHGDSFETCKDCIDNGFSSVMIDGSSLPYDENVALTKKVVEYAHQFDVTVVVSLEFWPESRTRSRQRSLTTHSLQRSLTLSQRPVSTHWQSQSEQAMAHSSSQLSSAPETLTAFLFRHRSASTSSKRSRRSFLVSQLSSTVPHQSHRSTSRSSTSTVESSRTASEFLRSSSERPQRAQSARSTSTQTEDLQ